MLQTGEPEDPSHVAEEAGLRYTSDAGPGIRRKRAGKSFTYLGTDGRTLRDAHTLERIRRLAIPPAWTDVWICQDPRGHIPATGQDARGRKQYRYHAAWRAVRDALKYGHMLAFADAQRRSREAFGQTLSEPERCVLDLLREARGRQQTKAA